MCAHACVHDSLYMEANDSIQDLFILCPESNHLPTAKNNFYLHLLIVYFMNTLSLEVTFESMMMST